MTYDEYLTKAQALGVLIQSGDVCDYATEDTIGRGVVVGSPALNCFSSYTVALRDDHYIMPHDVTTITRVERSGVQVWPPEWVQGTLW